MKKYISILVTGIVFVSMLSGCSKEKSKLPDTSKYTTTTTLLSEESKKSSNLTKPKDNATTSTKRYVSNTTTSLYENTTAYNGAGNLSKRKVTITYEQNGEQKEIQVTVITGFENEMLSKVNNLRKIAGKNPLKINDELQNAAVIRAAEATVNWSHTRPNGTKCFTVLDKLSIRPSMRSAGENLGKNQKSVDEVMNAWMSSKGHKDNIISTSTDYNYVGFAWVIAPNGDNVWCQIFAYLDI